MYRYMYRLILRVSSESHECVHPSTFCTISDLACARACTHTHTHTHTRACTHVCASARMCTHACVCTRAVSTYHPRLRRGVRVSKIGARNGQLLRRRGLGFAAALLPVMHICVTYTPRIRHVGCTCASCMARLCVRCAAEHIHMYIP